MKRTVFFLALALALAAAQPAPAAAQTRISVAVGLGVPRPFVSGVVVVGGPRRYGYYPDVYYPAPAVIVVPAPRPYFYRYYHPLVVRRLYVGRYHRRRHCEYDDE